MEVSNIISFIYSKKNVLFTILPSLVIIGIWTIFTPDFKSRQYKLEIKQLKALNDSLKLKNDSILYQIENLKIDMERSDEIIHTLFEESKVYEEKAQNLTNQLKTIKKQYEKASSHANDFTSGEIVEYFSNIK